MKFGAGYRWPHSGLPNGAILGYLFLGFLGIGAYFFIYNFWVAGELNIKEQIASYDKMRAIAAYSIKPERKKKVDSSVTTYLKPGTGAELTATIQSKLKEIADTSGAQVSSASPLKMKTNGPIALVGASLQMSGTTQSIYNFISEVEKTKPYLFVDRMLIRSNEGPGVNSPSETSLTVELDVYGAILSDDLLGKVEGP
jgi:hypothetical protein